MQVVHRVLGDQLPVAVEFNLQRRRDRKVAHVEKAKIFPEGRDEIGQGLANVIEIDEHETLPNTKLDGLQLAASGVEPFRFLHIGCADQLT